MSDAISRTIERQDFNDRQLDPSMSGEPAWWIMLSREVADLWLGGKALYLILAFSILLGIETFVLATNFELSLFTPQEMVFETLKSSLQVALLIGLIIGADSISGERERATLEGLLLTPAAPRQIIFGKYLAALTAWPASLAITVPFLLLLSQGSVPLGQAVLGGFLVGFLLIPAFTAIGVIVSLWCNSNKTSFFIGLGIFLVFILMGQVLATTKTGLWGQLLLAINPIPAGFDFLGQLIVGQRAIAELWSSLISPLIFAAVSNGLLFLYIGPRLRIEAGRSERVSKLWARLTRMLGLTVLLSQLFFASIIPSRAMHLTQAEAQPGDLQITINIDTRTVRTGESVNFETVLTNVGAEPSPPVITAMNIINLSESGDVVDPEDWSPERTQYLDSLAPNEAITLYWQVNTVLDGDYIVYIVAVPEPETAETSSQTIVSRGLHLSVTRFTRLNSAGVLPYAIGLPLFVLLVIIVVFRLRYRQIDTGAPE